MTTVTVHEKSAVEGLTKPKEVVVTDALGRKIKLRKPGILATYRLIEALGDLAANKTYLNSVAPLVYVESIDGEAVEIDSKLQIEALLQRLDTEGMDGLFQGLEEHFNANPAADKAKIKK